MLPRFSPEVCQQIEHPWQELLSLNSTVSKPAAELSDECIAEFVRRARKGGEKFMAVYQRKNITPYIHAMINHVGEFMKIHGSIILFTQQDLEKKHSFSHVTIKAMQLFAILLKNKTELNTKKQLELKRSESLISIVLTVTALVIIVLHVPTHLYAATPRAWEVRPAMVYV